MGTSRPNIVFLLADDQRFDTIRALGNPLIQTPNLDRLVARGTAFTQAHIPCGTVGAICMPSRAMIHTGRSLFHLENDGAGIPPAHALLGETLRGAGYRSYGIGKWHNGPASFNRSFEDGAEIFFGGMWDHWNVPVCDYDPSGKYASRIPIVLDPFHSNQVQHVVADRVHSGVHSSELFTSRAVDFLTRVPADRPFFLSVAYLAPHDPRTMPERFQKLYDPARVPVPPNFLPEHPFDFFDTRGMRDENLAAFPRREEEIRRHLAEYWAMISHLDDQLGRIVGRLESRGLLEETIIVFAGDNGLALGQHGLMGKQNLYEPSVRIPLVLAGPGIPAGETRGDWAYLFDLFPTLCDLTGIPVPPTVAGKSLAPCLKGGDAAHRDELYFAYTGFARGVKHGGLKLMEYAAGPCGRKTQLFDLARDPGEQIDLSADPARASDLAGLRQRLLRLRDEWGDERHPLGKKFWEAYRAGSGA